MSFFNNKGKVSKELIIFAQIILILIALYLIFKAVGFS